MQIVKKNSEQFVLHRATIQDEMQHFSKSIKQRGTGGTNDLFSKHIDIPANSPEPHYRYQDQSWHHVPQVACHILNSFTHYMSAYLMIIKPTQMTMDQVKFLEKHRQWLSIKTKSTQFKPMVWDKVKKCKVENRMCLYIETPEWMAIPRFYALALYGPDVWQTHMIDVDHPPIIVPQQESMMHHWTKYYRMSLSRMQDDAWINPVGQPCVITEKVQQIYAPVVPPWIATLDQCSHQHTQMLTFKGKLRTHPVDQAQLICKMIRQWQAGRAGPPGMIASAATGLGKTLMAIVAWMFMDMTFDTADSDEHQLVGILNQPRSTGRALFIVHGIELMEQVMESIEQYIDGCRIGIIQADRRADPTRCDIAIASTDTIANQNFPSTYWRHFRLVIMDEAHQNTAGQYQRAVSKIAVPNTLSLTATPREWSLPWILGPVVFYQERPHMDQCVNMIVNQSRVEAHEVEYDKEGKPDFHKMAAKLVSDLHRSTWISQLAIDQVYPNLAKEHDFAIVKRHSFWSTATPTPKPLWHQRHSNNNQIHAEQKEKNKVESMTIEEAFAHLNQEIPKAKRIKTRDSDDDDQVQHLMAASQIINDEQAKHLSKPTHPMHPDGDGLGGTTTHESSLVTVKHIHVNHDPNKLTRRTLMLSISVQHLIMMQHLVAQAYIDMSSEPERYMIVRTHLRQIVVVDKHAMTEAHWSHFDAKWKTQGAPRFNEAFFNQWFKQHPEHAPDKTLNFDDRVSKDRAADAMHEDMYCWTPIYGAIPGVEKSKQKRTAEEKLNDKCLWKPVVMEHDARPALPIMTSLGLLVGLNYTVGKHPDHTCPNQKHVCKRLGRLTRVEKLIAKHSQFVMATWQIASVGMDEPGLDTLWELTPRSDIQQADGRIQRIMPDKQLITKNEMVESWSSPYQNMAMLHLKYYNLEHRKVNHYAVDAKHSRLVKSKQ